ncbi:dienelactone hydrolase family protein [Streptomyces sp. NPDC002513]
MHFTAETSSDGVVERDFTVDGVPGVLWSPASGSGPAPLVLLGHGGGQHKRSPGVLVRARQLATGLGYSVAAIDLPGHGDRPPTARDEQQWAALERAKAEGESIAGVVVEYGAELAERAVPEWQATLDALQELPEIGRHPVGYSGAMLSTVTGVHLMAVEPRITAAVFRCFFCSDSMLQAAGRVIAPIQLLLQWHDTDIPREDGLALFDAFGSKEKTLHANAGTHHQVPRFEADSDLQFFARHLVQAVPSPA